MEWCISDRLKEGCGMELRMWDGTHRFRGAPDGTGQEDGEKKGQDLKSHSLNWVL